MTKVGISYRRYFWLDGIFRRISGEYAKEISRKMLLEGKNGKGGYRSRFPS